MWRDDDYDLDEYDDERYLEEQDRHEELLEAVHGDDPEGESEGPDEGGGPWITRGIPDENGFEDWEFDHAEVAADQASSDIDDEWEEFFDRFNDHDEDTEDPFGGIA